MQAPDKLSPEAAMDLAVHMGVCEYREQTFKARLKFAETLFEFFSCMVVYSAIVTDSRLLVGTLAGALLSHIGKTALNNRIAQANEERAVLGRLAIASIGFAPREKKAMLYAAAQLRDEVSTPQSRPLLTHVTGKPTTPEDIDRVGSFYVHTEYGHELLQRVAVERGLYGLQLTAMAGMSAYLWMQHHPWYVLMVVGICTLVTLCKLPHWLGWARKSREYAKHYSALLEQYGLTTRYDSDRCHLLLLNAEGKEVNPMGFRPTTDASS